VRQVFSLGRERSNEDAERLHWRALTTGKKLRAWLADQRQQCSTEDSERLRGSAVLLARAVFVHLRVPFPVVFVFDAPVASDDFKESLGAGARGEAGDEVAVSFLRRVGSFFRALACPRNPHYCLRKRQSDSLGFYRDYSHFMRRFTSVSFAF
jgi:hypothetical protein